MRKSAFLAVLLAPFALPACGDDGTTADTGDDTTGGTEAPTQTTNEPDSSTTDDPSSDDNGCTPDDQCRTNDDCLAGQTCLPNCTCFGEPSGDTDACYADQGAYGNCIDEGAGACENGAGAQCAQGGGAGVCFFPCSDACDCPAPPDGASVGCMAFIQDNPNSFCHLDCSGGKACPDGMTCFGNYLCVWPTGGGSNSCADNCGVYTEGAACQCDADCAEFGDCCNDICTHCEASFPDLCVPPPGYENCATQGPAICRVDEECLQLEDEGTHWAVCSFDGCTAATDCPDAPATGNAPVTCGDLGDGNVCYLDCSNEETCPDDMVCTPEGTCAFAGPGFLLYEGFHGGEIPMGWTLLDEDGLIPDAEVAFVTEAWVVIDDLFDDYAAVSTSYYDPIGQADDWLITPAITLGSDSVLSWKALTPSAMWPDGYEVRISTTGPNVDGFMDNAPLFSIAAEGQQYTYRSVDLADYANAEVWIAFRNNTEDQLLLFVDDIAVIQ